MNFDDDCWQLMTKCWDQSPQNRPYLGEVQEKLELVYAKCETTSTAATTRT